MYRLMKNILNLHTLSPLLPFPSSCVLHTNRQTRLHIGPKQQSKRKARERESREREREKEKERESREREREREPRERE